MRVGGVFEEVLKNISEFWDLRCSKEFKRLPIRVSIRVSDEETQDEAAFSRFWGKYCDDAYMLPAEERWDTYNGLIVIWSSLVSIHGSVCIYGMMGLSIHDVDYKSSFQEENIKIRLHP